MIEQPLRATRVVVRDMTADDIGAVVDVHMRAFPDYLLTHMGRAYLHHYYTAFLGDRKHYATVAQIGSRVVGFVTGTTEIERLNARVYRPPIAIALTVAGRFITDPVLQRHLLAKRHHVARTLRALTRRKTTRRPPSRIQTRLLSIGVSPDSQRMGVAQALVSGFNSRLHADGIATVGLSVRHDNQSAIAFYDRTGWIRELVNTDGIYYIRSTAT